MMNYKDLEAWKRGIELTRRIYNLTETFPKDERFGLTSQIRRAIVSVPSNIAEGCGRHSRKEGIRFLRISRGSLYEVETQLIIAQTTGIIAQDSCDELVIAVNICLKTINGLIRFFETADKKPKPQT